MCGHPHDPPQLPQPPTGRREGKGKKVQLFEVGRPDMHPCRQFPAHFVVHMPLCSLSSFVLRVLCLVSGGARGLSLGVASLGGAREPSRAAAYWTRGAGGTGLQFNTFICCASSICVVTQQVAPTGTMYADVPPPACTNAGLSKHRNRVFPHFCPLNQNLVCVSERGRGVSCGICHTVPVPHGARVAHAHH